MREKIMQYNRKLGFPLVSACNYPAETLRFPLKKRRPNRGVSFLSRIVGSFPHNLNVVRMTFLHS